MLVGGRKEGPVRGGVLGGLMGRRRHTEPKVGTPLACPERWAVWPRGQRPIGAVLPSECPRGRRCWCLRVGSNELLQGAASKVLETKSESFEEDGMDKHVMLMIGQV